MYPLNFFSITFPDPIMTFKHVLQSASVAAAASMAAVTAGMPVEAQAASTLWAPIQVPFEDTLFDVDFDR